VNVNAGGSPVVRGSSYFPTDQAFVNTFGRDQALRWDLNATIGVRCARE